MVRMMSRSVCGSVSLVLPRLMSQVPISPTRRHFAVWSGPTWWSSGSISRQRSWTYSQRVLNRQAVGRRPGPGVEPGMPVSARAWRQVRDRVEQRAGVGVRGLAEHRVPRAELDDLPRVHDGDPVGDVGDDGQVVGDVERRDLVAAAQLAHGLQHHALGGDVQAGGRLVQHQHLRARQERHRQRDALHLAAGELVRVARQELVVVGQADLAQAGAGALEALLGRADVVQLQQLHDLPADPDRRVERGARVLRHVGDLHAADLADLLPGQREHVLALEHHRAALDERARAGRRRAAPCRRWSCPIRTRRPGRPPRPAAARG